jgi:exosortase/archaeosortase family protein
LTAALATEPDAGALGLTSWLDDPSRRHQLARAVVVVAAVIGAYHYSLLTLVRGLGLETPLAYLGLVPVIGLGLAVSRLRLISAPPDIHDREFDYLVGVPLLAGALAILVLLPHRLSTLFWAWRLDLLSLPLFVAGAVAIVFGVRTTWRLRVAIAYLLLAWPVPYTTLLNAWMLRFTDLTISGVRAVLRVVPVARPVAGADGSLFTVPHAGQPFVVSVASACGGVNGMVGFLLVGTALAVVARGRRLPKAIWLAAGLVVVWAVNVGRIMLLLIAIRTWGAGVALNDVHPWLGLITLALAVALIAHAMDWFGLGLALPGDPPGPTRSARTLPVPRATIALTVVIAGALLLGAADTGLQRFELTGTDLGAPRLVGFLTRPGTPAGWVSRPVDRYPWVQQYFGRGSQWVRYVYRPLDGASPWPVYADVISTKDPFSFWTYGVAACYHFHGARVHGVRPIDLPGGVTGTLISWGSPNHGGEWTTLYWEWPVQAGHSTRYERVVLILSNSARAAAPSPDRIPVARAASPVHSGSVTEPASSDGFLIGFAQDVVKAQAAESQGTASS